MIWSTFGRRLVQLTSFDALKTALGITVNDSNWSGADLTVPNGGTGGSSFTAYAVVCGGTTSTAALQSIASVGSSGNVLTSNGAGALPTFQAAAAVDYGAGNAALSYGGIGTYVFGYINNTAGVIANSTYAGSDIEPAGIGLSGAGTLTDDTSTAPTALLKGGSALSGTWRAMGQANQNNGSDRTRITLFLRTV